MDAKVWIPKPMMATFVAGANWLYIYSQLLVGSDGFPSHGNLLYTWYTNMIQYEGNTQLWKDHFPHLIWLFLRKIFLAWCDRKDWFGAANVLSDVSKRDQFATNISRSWGVSTAKMMSGSQHSRWVFQSWHRLQRCSEKLCRKQTCMCKCRLQRTCGVTSKTSPGVLYYLLFTLDLNGRSLPIFWIYKTSWIQQVNRNPTRKPGVLAVWVLQVGEQSPQTTESVAKAGGFWRREISQ